MERIVLNPIKITYDIQKTLGLEDILEESTTYGEVRQLIEATKDVIKPRAVLKWCKVEKSEGNSISIAGHPFQSRLVYDKLEKVEKVFLYVVTAGDELDKFIGEYSSKTVNLVKYAILTEARKEVETYLEDHFSYTNTAKLSPGSLPDWPVKNNRILFEIIGDVSKDIEVELKEDNFMRPLNSVSGIFFADGGDYVNCSLCKNLDCIGRQVLFNEKEYQRIFAS